MSGTCSTILQICPTSAIIFKTERSGIKRGQPPQPSQYAGVHLLGSYSACICILSQVALSPEHGSSDTTIILADNQRLPQIVPVIFRALIPLADLRWVCHMTAVSVFASLAVWSDTHLSTRVDKWSYSEAAADCRARKRGVLAFFKQLQISALSLLHFPIYSHAVSPAS